MSHAPPIKTILKPTSSLCPVCRAQVDAQVYELAGKVYLHKSCPTHGAFDVLINSDRRFYYESHGASSSCCGGAGCGASDAVRQPVGALIRGHNAQLIDQAATCVALIEIVQTCNLQCPTCYADSPFAAPQQVKALSIEEFWSRINSVIARKGPIDILQLSGGEPTLHPQFFELLEAVQRDERIGYSLLNTNGLLLAQDDAFMRRLGELHGQHSRFEVYLQYDGPQETGQRQLRGADLRSVRTGAIEASAQAGIPVTLAMTVSADNLPHLGDTLHLALRTPGVRGITFQPRFTSGRIDPQYVQIERNLPRLNVADIVTALIAQSDGLLSTRDFTPLPCGDPNCHTVGYLLRRGEGFAPVSDIIDLAAMQGFLRDRVNFNVEDLHRCGCASEPLGHALKSLEVGPDAVLRLFIKPFMDAWTYDQDRIDRCCVHVVGEGGKLESFCRHYAMRE